MLVTILLKIAERIDYSFDKPKYYLPDFPVPDKNKSTEEFLYEKVKKEQMNYIQKLLKKLKKE